MNDFFAPSRKATSFFRSSRDGRAQLSPQCVSHPGYVSDEKIGTPGTIDRASAQCFSSDPESRPTAAPSTWPASSMCGVGPSAVKKGTSIPSVTHTSFNRAT